MSQSDASRDQSEPSDEEDASDSKMRDELTLVGRVFYPPSVVAREGRNSFRLHQHTVVTARTQATPVDYLNTKAVADRG